MKKITILILILTIFMLTPSLSLRADMGPKRTLDIHIKGIQEPYFLGLLMKGSLPENQELLIARENISYYEDNFPEMLYTFAIEGYVSADLVLPWGLRAQHTRENYYIYTYNPPQKFKLIIIFEDQTHLVSKTIETSLFNSKVLFDLTDVDTSFTQFSVGTLDEVFPVQTMTLELTLRIIGTIFIEIIILFLFGYTLKKSYKLVTIVNLVTQVSLTGFMFATKYFILPGLGEIMVLLIGEAIIFLFEIIVFRIYLKEKSPKRAMLYALVANTMTLIASYSVMILMLNL